jgi:ligand-binding SRPBCC domain-containing protein
LPAPGFALQLVLGEFAETLTASQLVLPAAAENAGFVWAHPNLERAMIAAVAPGSSRTGGVRTFESEQFVPQPIETVFSFFSDARNLERITPPALRFEIVAAPDALAAGAEIAYKLHLHGVPFSWKTLIARWEAPNRFVDVQLRGPYACWNHEHSFESVAGGTMVRDHVTYVLPLAPFGALGAGLVESDVNAIFAFRRGAIEAALGAPKTAA